MVEPEDSRPEADEMEDPMVFDKYIGAEVSSMGQARCCEEKW